MFVVGGLLIWVFWVGIWVGVDVVVWIWVWVFECFCMGFVCDFGWVVFWRGFVVVFGFGWVWILVVIWRCV